MLTTTYFNVYETLPVVPDGNPYCMGKERLINPHDKFTTKEEAQEFLNKKRDQWHSYLKSELANADEARVVEHLTAQLLETKYEIKEEVVEYTHATEHLWSDSIAYEIVKVVSENTLEVRRMHSDHFADGDTVYESDDKQDTIRIRRKKNNPELWGWRSLRFHFSH